MAKEHSTSVAVDERETGAPEAGEEAQGAAAPGAQGRSAEGEEAQAAPAPEPPLEGERAPSGAAVSEPPGAAAGAAPEAQAQPGPEELRRLLEEARRSAEEHRDALLRSRAELENLRKRAEREVESAHKFGLERLMSELLPVKDSLELGLSAAANDEADPTKVREGLELTLKMFSAAVEKFGLEEVNPQGERFDPDYHQAMSAQEAETAESGTVITVVQKGYRLNERLIRPAMVIVAK